MTNSVPEHLYVTPEIVIKFDGGGAGNRYPSQVTTRTIYDNFSQYSLMVIPSDGMPIRVDGKRSLPRSQEQRDRERDDWKDRNERCALITVTKTFPNYAMLESHYDVLKAYADQHGLSDRSVREMLEYLEEWLPDNRPRNRGAGIQGIVIEITYRIPVDHVEDRGSRVYLPDLATVVVISPHGFNSNFPTHPVHWREPEKKEVSKEETQRDSLSYYSAKLFVVDNKRRRDKRFISLFGKTVTLQSNRVHGMDDGVYLEVVNPGDTHDYSKKIIRTTIEDAAKVYGLAAERDLADYAGDREQRLRDEKLRLDEERLANDRLKMKDETVLRQEQREDLRVTAERKAEAEVRVYRSNERKDTADILSSVIKIAAGVTAAIVSVFTMFKLAT